MTPCIQWEAISLSSQKRKEMLLKTWNKILLFLMILKVNYRSRLKKSL